MKKSIKTKYRYYSIIPSGAESLTLASNEEKAILKFYNYLRTTDFTPYTSFKIKITPVPFCSFDFDQGTYKKYEVEIITIFTGYLSGNVKESLWVREL